MRIFNGLDDLAAAAGTHLGHSDWYTVDQEQIDRFAQATGDHQWIHVDRQAAAQGPFGTTIAHGFLTLSLLPVLANEVYRIDGLQMVVNYGCNKVRFPNAVKVDQRVRAGIELAGLTATAAGTQISLKATIEIDGTDKPACVVDWVLLAV